MLMQPNQPMQLTSAIAAQGVLRPPCSLRTLAADWHVVQAENKGVSAAPDKRCRNFVGDSS